MQIKRLLVVLLAMLCFSYVQAADVVVGNWGSTTPESWSVSTPLPIKGLTGHGVVVISNNIYCIGGASGGSAKTNVYKFNGTTWTEVAGLPAARSDFGIAQLAPYTYVIAGQTASTNVYRFDGTTWSQVAGLPAARAFISATAVGTKIYAAGGYNSTVKTNMYVFNGTSWSELAGLKNPVQNHRIINGLTGGNWPASDNLILIGGQGGISAVTNVYQYDISANTWAQIRGLPVTMHSMSAVIFSNSVFVIGGSSSTYGGMGATKTNVYSFNGATWTPFIGIPAARADLSSGVLGNSLYAIGGSVNASTDTNIVYKYNPPSAFSYSCVSNANNNFVIQFR